jgi:glyoxylase-like metal-dependent hydrolase (beta-lactamase superfamily II)
MLRSGAYRTKIELLDPSNPNIYTLTTEPKFGIGQRCFFIKTPNGNVLWDLISVLDKATEEWILQQGGLKAIVISHPHYYGTHRYWIHALKGPFVCMSVEDKEWLSFREEDGMYQWITGPTMDILPDVTAIKVGGHFQGSLCLHVKGRKEHGGSRLFVADSVMTVPSGLGPFAQPPPGVASYAFMWSIPNMVGDD